MSFENYNRDQRAGGRRYGDDNRQQNDQYGMRNRYENQRYDNNYNRSQVYTERPQTMGGYREFQDRRYNGSYGNRRYNNRRFEQVRPVYGRRFEQGRPMYDRRPTYERAFTRKQPRKSKEQLDKELSAYMANK